MPSFEYLATNEDGKTFQNVVFGRTLEEAAASLRQQGLRVVEIKDAYSAHDPLRGADPAFAPPFSAPPSEATSAPRERPREGSVDPAVQQRSYLMTGLVGPLVGQVGLKEQSFFFRQLGAMVEAGVPLGQSLDTLSKQSRNVKMRGVIRELGQHAEEGRPISAGLQRYPEVFSPLVVSLLRAGEEGGFLAESMKQLATYMDQEIELRNMIRRETFMPKLYVVASILIISGANLIISGINKSQGTQAPGLWSPLTEISTWYWLAPVLIGMFLFVRIGLANYWVKVVWDRFILMIPFIGNTSYQFAMAKFGRSLAALHKGGVPITKSMQLAADSSGNEWLRMKISPAAKRLEGGDSITEIMRETGAFSPIVMDMVSTGEMTGSMEQMIAKMSEFYEEEGKVRARQSANVIAVVAFLGVAIYIAIVVINFYTGVVSGLGDYIPEE